MRVKHWLIGCAICFAGIGSAVATTADSRELDNSLHGNGNGDNSGGTRDGGNGGEPGLAHDNTARNTGSDSRKGASGSSSDRSSGDMTAPPHAQQAHFGWQSLLPGSIQ